MENNPVKYVDLDGRELDVSEETIENQLAILRAVQYLTDDTLELENGKIIIAQRNDGELHCGTQLVFELISSDKTIKIQIGERNSCSKPINCGIPSGSAITWNNFMELQPTFNIAAGTRYGIAPKEIVLGHELIHAYHNMNGNSKGSLLYRVGTFENPTNYTIEFSDGMRHKTSDSLEEYETINGSGISENALRTEHGIAHRGIY